MPRPHKYKIGDLLANNKLEVLEILSRGSGKHSRVKIFCHWCNSIKYISSHLLHKRRSCGCMRHNSSIWHITKVSSKPHQLPPGESAFNSLYHSYASRADKRGLEFLLDKEYFRKLCVGPCIYCGDLKKTIIKGQGKTSGDFFYTGVDRKDNSKGYTIENSVPCCSRCNWMKHTLPINEFISHVNKISEHLKDVGLEA